MSGTESRCADPAGSASKKLDYTSSIWPASTCQLSVANCRLCRKELRGVSKGEEQSLTRVPVAATSAVTVVFREGDAMSGVLCARGVLSGERRPIEHCGRIAPRPSGQIPTTPLTSAHQPLRSKAADVCSVGPLATDASQHDLLRVRGGEERPHRRMPRDAKPGNREVRRDHVCRQFAMF